MGKTGVKLELGLSYVLRDERYFQMSLFEVSRANCTIISPVVANMYPTESCNANLNYRKNSKIWDTSNNCHNCPKNRKV